MGRLGGEGSGNHGPLFQIWDGEILAVIELKFVSIGEEVSQP